MHTTATLNPNFQLRTRKPPPMLLASSIPTLQTLQQPALKQPPPQQYFQGRPVDVPQPPPLRSSNSSFDPTASTSNEPIWDGHQRDSYKYLKSPNDYLSQQPEPRPDKMVSNTWQHARFDIDNIADVLDIKNGGIFLPWEAPRPDHGRIKCFPIRLPSIHLVKQFYLSSFNTGLAAVGFSRLIPKTSGNSKTLSPSSDPTMFAIISIGTNALFYKD
jgi:hypothetical protein